MPTIRDLVGALGTREGVEAAVVLGRDGLLIDCRTAPGVDAESIAARIPAVVTAADALGEQGGRGALTTAVLEYEHGIAAVSVLSGDAILLVLARPDAAFGKLLLELRRHRASIAALI